MLSKYDAECPEAYCFTSQEAGPSRGVSNSVPFLLFLQDRLSKSHPEESEAGWTHFAGPDAESQLPGLCFKKRY